MEVPFLFLYNVNGVVWGVRPWPISCLISQILPAFFLALRTFVNAHFALSLSLEHGHVYHPLHPVSLSLSQIANQTLLLRCLALTYTEMTSCSL